MLFVKLLFPDFGLLLDLLLDLLLLCTSLKSSFLSCCNCKQVDIEINFTQHHDVKVKYSKLKLNDTVW